MTAHIAPTDLKVLDAEPRVQDLRLADALQFEKPLNIRQLIKRNADELAKHGEVFCTVQKTSPSGGRPGEEFWLNEPQSVLICMFSRTDKAAEVRAEIISVFMAWRRGHLPGHAPLAPFDIPVEGGPLQAYSLKLDTVRLAARVHGPHAARALWLSLGLPPVPGFEPERDSEAWRCLNHLLATKLADSEQMPTDHWTIRRVIERCFNDETEFTLRLRTEGIHVIEDGDDVGFVVANALGTVDRHFSGTPWVRNRWPYVLRRLPGAKPWKRLRYGTFQARGTFLPAELLDEAAMPGKPGSGEVVPFRKP